MVITKNADAREFGQDGFAIRSLIAPSQGSKELAMWTIEAQPGATTPPHSLSREEVFLLQRGTLQASVGDTSHELSSGDALAVPPGVEFKLHNGGQEPAVLVACSSAGLQATVGGESFPPPWAV
jgi:quercetin dioxygenase-like cupin family protein